MRSIHTIHGDRYTLHLTGAQHLSEVTQGRVIGRAVNLLREMTAEDVKLAANQAINITGDTDGELHHHRAKLIKQIDEAIRANYTPRYSDDCGPMIDLSAAKG